MRRLLLVSLTLCLAAVPAASAQAANRWIQQKKPLNIAHQGGEDEFPSNTMYAFRKAVRAGADMLELDVGVILLSPMGRPHEGMDCRWAVAFLRKSGEGCLRYGGSAS